MSHGVINGVGSSSVYIGELLHSINPVANFLASSAFHCITNLQSSTVQTPESAMIRLRRPLCPNLKHLRFGERPLLCRPVSTQAAPGGWQRNWAGRPNLRYANVIAKLVSLIGGTSLVATVCILSFTDPAEIMSRINLPAKQKQPGSPEELRERVHLLEEKAKAKHEYYDHAARGGGRASHMTNHSLSLGQSEPIQVDGIEETKSRQRMADEDEGEANADKQIVSDVSNDWSSAGATRW
ncbi:hypothetical protein ACRALDRAFT_1093280 [Sodiomyces alcalophilus JCM 7366]|uniref:uncharacterized protein n=1 Tax=Sodiomyces alcalophilus JCM 7366 TaxID=591952 RepID=UPI0039B4C60F